MMKNPRQDIATLIDAYVDGSLDETGATELLRCVEENPSVLDTLHRHLTVNEMLKESGRGLEMMVPLAKFVADLNKEQTNQRRLWIRGLAALSLCILLLVGTAWLYSLDGRSELRLVSKPATLPYQATITGLSDPVWIHEPQTSDVGLTVTSNRYRLKSGKFAVQFSNDVQMAFSGLTSLLVDSPTRIECLFGNTSFNVSPQSPKQPFEVKIPQGTVIVTGTRFSVASDRLVSEVHVKEGSVRFEPVGHGAAPIILRAGEALSVSQTSQIRQFSSNDALYLSEDQMPVRPLHRLKEWQGRGDRLNLDPFLLTRFDFIRQPMQNIVNKSEFGASEIPFGKANRYRWEQGRFLGKWGVRLDSQREAISFESDKAPESFSVVLGMRVDQLPKDSRPLFASGCVSCKLTSEGRIELTTPTLRAESSIVWDQELLGKWIMLSLVFDMKSPLAIVYVDGRVFEEIQLNQEADSVVPIAVEPFGSVRLGPFPGLIDEFMLFERRLSEPEIREIF